MFSLFAVVLMISAITGQSGPIQRVLSPCELISQGKLLDGHQIEFRAVVISGPHDTYIVASRCTKHEKSNDYIAVDLDTHSKQLKKIIKALSSSDKGKPFPTATLTGTVHYSDRPIYGFISARVELEVVSASEIKE